MDDVPFARGEKYRGDILEPPLKLTNAYIKDGSYESNHSFALPDPSVNTYYTDTRYDGTSGALGIVTITMTSGTGARATLNEAQPCPVSFDWTAGSPVVDFSAYGSLDALRSDIGLQEIISINYGSGIWGMLSDKMEWESSDPDKVSVDYPQGGIYSDIRNYNYTSYAPASDFLLVGKNESGTATVTATHAKTGMSASLTVKTNTLVNKLYVFRFYPQATTSVTYTTSKNETRTLTSNADGELAVYEPDGISGPVMALSTYENETYAGTIFNEALETGEKGIAATICACILSPAPS